MKNLFLFADHWVSWSHSYESLCSVYFGTRILLFHRQHLGTIFGLKLSLEMLTRYLQAEGNIVAKWQLGGLIPSRFPILYNRMIYSQSSGLLYRGKIKNELISAVSPCEWKGISSEHYEDKFILHARKRYPDFAIVHCTRKRCTENVSIEKWFASSQNLRPTSSLKFHFQAFHKNSQAKRKPKRTEFVFGWLQ